MKPIIVVILLAVCCLAVGHLIGYFMRKREEKPGKITIFIDKVYHNEISEGILAVEYKGVFAPRVEIREMDLSEIKKEMDPS